MSPLTIIIGGGAAGMVAAIESARNGNETILLEKNEKLGKKLYITGKGRCNITNLCDEEEFLKNIIGNPYFLYSSIYAFNAETCIKYFEELGLPLKVERGNRVFPKSDKSSDVTRVLEKTMRELGVKIRLNTEVLDIVSENGKITAVKTASENISCDKVIVATGGLSYPQTGSTGDGYKFAKKMGHEVTALYPSLVSIEAKENWVKNLAGVSLKNVELSVKQGKKVIYKGFGEMLFSHKGISGPLVLTASRKIVGIKSDLDIFIDLKPALSEKELDTRLLKDFEKFANKDFKNSLDDLLPQSLIPVFVDLSLISLTKKVNEITKEERRRVIDLFKNFRLSFKNLAGYNEAVVTVGGVSTREICPQTMESKKISGLYFAGEVIDIDGLTGGFNLQIAFATGYVAGQN